MLPKYKRVLLKLSGESLMGDKNFGLDSNKSFHNKVECSCKCVIINFQVPSCQLNSILIDKSNDQDQSSDQDQDHGVHMMSLGFTAYESTHVILDDICFMTIAPR
jgi:hypothetical protein